MSRIIISGAGGGSQNRLEINDFVKNNKFFSLYIQALQAMSTDSQSGLQSFFQIAGIHGLPYVVWDDATSNQKPKSASPTTEWEGYCTHGSVVFPTWHRPYVALYEQTLHEHAQRIAATYTVDQNDWKQAAANLRQPFWDWALNSTPPDEVIALKQVVITGPNGNQIQVDNPLYHYKFHPIDPSFPAPFSNWQTTLRRPADTSPDATDDVAALRKVLATAQKGITASTYNMLARIHTWPAFSNHTPGDGGSASNSLEGIHDGIHGNVGGQGHMGDLSVAGFDPIFFLHHANVDRMISLWAALNPGVWVTPGNSEDGSFTLPPNVKVDQTTELTPFWKEQTTFWASAGLQDTSKLGYTYPDFNGLDMGNPDAVQNVISDRVNQLYGSNVFGASSVPSSIPSPVSTVKAPVSHNPAPGPSPAAPSPAAPSPAAPSPAQHVLSPHPTSGRPDHGLYDWTARIEFKKYELQGSFSVLVFLGPVPENPQVWRISPNYVGAVHAFVNSVPERCANCVNQADIVLEGFVHLNHAIARLSGLTSLDPNVIVPYLTKALQWKVLKSNGNEAELQSHEVAVIATPLSYPTGAKFPVPGQSRRHNGITFGRRGGSRHGDVVPT